MHGCRKALGLPLTAVTLLLGMSVPVHADSDGQNYWPDDNKPVARTSFQASVQSNSNGVDVHITGRQTVPGDDQASHAPAPAPPANAAPAPAAPAVAPPADQPSQPVIHAWTDETGMHRIDPDGTRTDLSPPLIGFGSQVSWQAESQQHSQQTPWILTVNDQFQGVVWLPDMSPGPVIMNQPQPINNQMPQGDGGSHDPRMVALDVLAHIPLPPAVVRMNPDLGMVAMPGWFWVDGYDGHDISQSRTVTFPPPAPGLPPTSFTVTVRIWPTKYDWDFGDGTAIETHSLGKRYPDQSDVQHKYEFSSLPFPNGFAVRLTIEFAAEFRVNGGGPQALPPIRHTWESDFRVQELQPVLTQH